MQRWEQGDANSQSLLQMFDCLLSVITSVALSELQSQEPLVTISNVPYGKKGPLAINLWAKFGDMIRDPSLPPDKTGVCPCPCEPCIGNLFLRNAVTYVLLREGSSCCFVLVFQRATIQLHVCVCRTGAHCNERHVAGLRLQFMRQGV